MEAIFNQTLPAALVGILFSLLAYYISPLKKYGLEFWVCIVGIAAGYWAVPVAFIMFVLKKTSKWEHVKK